jgi:hypothetical protein
MDLGRQSHCLETPLQLALPKRIAAQLEVRPTILRSTLVRCTPSRKKLGKGPLLGHYRPNQTQESLPQMVRFGQ